MPVDPTRPAPPRVTAVLLAGGTGTRVGGARPKQLIGLAGRPMMAHALASFQAHPGIDEVLVLMSADHLGAAEELVAGSVAEGGTDKVRAVVPGGATRDGSTRVALETIAALHPDDADAGLVLVHDAARPLVSAAVVDRCLAALETYDAVTPAVASSDTLVEVSEDGVMTGIATRSRTRRAQTPQGFRVGVLRAAHARAVADPAFEPTDDASVVHRYLPGTAVAVVDGEDENLKVTGPVDVLVADLLLRRGREGSGA